LYHLETSIGYIGKFIDFWVEINILVSLNLVSLLIYFPNLIRPGDGEVTFLVFQSNCHLFATCLNHSKVEAFRLVPCPRTQKTYL